MKRTPSSRPSGDVPSPTPVARRGLLAGVGVAAGAAAAAHLALRAGAPSEPDAKSAGKAPEGQGYRVTAHVQRYYETTKA